MEIALIRHGKTQGNVERRYIGSTDEPLCPAGGAELRALVAQGAYPVAEHAYVSPLMRCRETCALTFPGVEETVVEDLREQAFGAFENRSYEELQFLPAYREWVETAGKAGAPQGEGVEAFRMRCRAAFTECVEAGFVRGAKSIAIVAHGGVLMAILSAYGRPERDFYGWQTANGHGFLLRAVAGEHMVEVLRELGGEGTE